MDKKELGNLGERIACEYLVKNGYKILCRNYRIKFGEIDILAEKNKIIHIVEVKALSRVSGPFSPEQRTNKKKQKKLIRLAEIWLEKNKYPQDCPYQIDIIGIMPDGVKHFENVVSDI